MTRHSSQNHKGFMEQGYRGALKSGVKEQNALKYAMGKVHAQIPGLSTEWCPPRAEISGDKQPAGEQKICYSCSHVVALWVCRDLWIIIISNVTEDGGSVPGIHRGTIGTGTLRVPSLGSITFDLAWSTSW